MTERHFFALGPTDPEGERLREALNQGEAVSVDGLPGKWFVERSSFGCDSFGRFTSKFAVIKAAHA